MVLNNLKGIGKRTLEKTSAENYFITDSVEEISRRIPRIEKNEGVLDKAKKQADHELKLAKENNIGILCFADKDYPNLLNKTHDKPIIIFLKGEWSPDQNKTISIIGTRKPTEHGELIGTRITEYFAQEGWSIVSGLALGCDAIAHRVALENNAHTIAVLAHGFNTIAPSQHKRLAHDILDNGGLLLSEYSYDTQPFPYQFAQRDRIQAGLSLCVIMIQSKLDGGSLHASRAILSYDRLLVVPRTTEYDSCNNENNVSANIIISSPDNKEKIDLLKCTEKQLKNIFILNNRNDYPILVEKLANKDHSILPPSNAVQLPLF